MAFSLNRVTLIGNLGRDQETKAISDSLMVTNFSLATTFSFKNREGSWQDETTWHNIVMYNVSDYYKEFLKKGRKIYVEGRLKMREYTGKDNIKRNYWEVVGEKLIPLENKSEGHYGSSAETYSPEPQGESQMPQTNDDLPF